MLANAIYFHFYHQWCNILFKQENRKWSIEELWLLEFRILHIQLDVRQFILLKFSHWRKITAAQHKVLLGSLDTGKCLCGVLPSHRANIPRRNCCMYMPTWLFIASENKIIQYVPCIPDMPINKKNTCLDISQTIAVGHKILWVT